MKEKRRGGEEEAVGLVLGIVAFRDSLRNTFKDNYDTHASLLGVSELPAC